MKERLTPVQRRVLTLMREHGTAQFIGGTREFWHEATPQGLFIHAYQMPEYFLRERGLIEPTGLPPWYRLTDKGAGSL